MAVRDLRWLGTELEFYHSDANIERQNITATVPILGSTQQNGMTPRVGLTTNNLAFNLIARYPGERWQPYVGIGGGLGFSLLRTAPDQDTSYYPIFNVMAGLKLFVTSHVSLFTEYKYTRADIEFGGQQFKADLRTNWFMGGAAYHF
ncbi:outer membrane protein [Nitrospira sp. Nam80]